MKHTHITRSYQKTLDLGRNSKEWLQCKLHNITEHPYGCNNYFGYKTRVIYSKLHAQFRVFKTVRTFPGQWRQRMAQNPDDHNGAFNYHSHVKPQPVKSR